MFSASVSKSYPPKLGESLDRSDIKRPALLGAFEPPVVPLEIGIASEIFPGEAGSIERSQMLVSLR
jgi:hypothetical protein